MTHAQVAARERERKEAHPELYCSEPGCLWRVSSGPCRSHPEAAMHEMVIDAVLDEARREGAEEMRSRAIAVCKPHMSGNACAERILALSVLPPECSICRRRHGSEVTHERE